MDPLSCSTVTHERRYERPAWSRKWDAKTWKPILWTLYRAQESTSNISFFHSNVHVSAVFLDGATSTDGLNLGNNCKLSPLTYFATSMSQNTFLVVVSMSLPITLCVSLSISGIFATLTHRSSPKYLRMRIFPKFKHYWHRLGLEQSTLCSLSQRSIPSILLEDEICCWQPFLWWPYSS